MIEKLRLWLTAEINSRLLADRLHPSPFFLPLRRLNALT